jgi:hypothetical protein
VFALPFLVGFMIDWLAVCGLAIHQLPAFRLDNTTQRYLLRWLPIVLRFTAVVLLAVQLLRWSSSLGQSVAGPISGRILPDSVIISWMLAAGIVMLLLALGASGRIAAILGLCLLGFQQTGAALTPEAVALLVIFTGILYLGTGSLSLWRPEERFIYKRAGERS